MSAAEPAIGPESRRAARLIVLDSKGRVLLFRVERRSGERYWATPGGGANEGETFREAAIREAEEELGIMQSEVEPLWEGAAEYAFRDRTIRQREQFFLIRDRVPEFSERTERSFREEGIIEARWLSLAEVEGVADPVYPSGFVSKLSEFGLGVS